jgi:hypothetical protein
MGFRNASDQSCHIIVPIESIFSRSSRKATAGKGFIEQRSNGDASPNRIPGRPSVRLRSSCETVASVASVASSASVHQRNSPTSGPRSPNISVTSRAALHALTGRGPEGDPATYSGERPGRCPCGLDFSLLQRCWPLSPRLRRTRSRLRLRSRRSFLSDASFCMALIRSRGQVS